MSLTLKEIIKDKDFNKLPKDVQGNLMTLLERVNKVREAWGKAMVVTSGLRTPEDQLRIYKEKGITDPKKVPMGSMHLKGAAVDVLDPKRELQAWCKTNEKMLESIGLWCESFDATENWVHFQCIAPKSGARFFKP